MTGSPKHISSMKELLAFVEASSASSQLPPSQSLSDFLSSISSLRQDVLQVDLSLLIRGRGGRDEPPLIQVLVKAVELVEVLVSVKYPASFSRRLGLVGFPNIVCGRQWFAIEVCLLCILLGCALLHLDLQITTPPPLFMPLALWVDQALSSISNPAGWHGSN
jgi:hypothetical protein